MKGELFICVSVGSGVKEIKPGDFLVANNRGRFVGFFRKF